MTAEEIREYLNNPQKPDLRYFSFQVAQELSDLAAVLLYDIYNRTTSRKKPIIKDGSSWTYDTLEVFAAAHPYASESGVRKAFLALKTAGLLRIETTGRFNKKKYDGKWWYALTDSGRKRAALRRMRFLPGVATSQDITKEKSTLGIPAAVILENIRHKFHEGDGVEFVTIEAAELKIPYSTKTIDRHLDAIVANGILERDVDNEDCYRVAADDSELPDEPLTVEPSMLLPLITVGAVGLITAPSGTAKTSFSTFAAVQHARAGVKVIYVTVEEPAENIANRMYAQEYGVSYTDLHRGDYAAFEEATTRHSAGSERTAAIAANLRLIDLSGQNPTPEQILKKIAELQQDGFAPEIVFIDQLEFTGAPTAHPTSAEGDESAGYGIAAPLAKPLATCFCCQPFKTWVLHQVDGSSRTNFELGDITGGKVVTDCFKPVLGIGRTDHDAQGIRVDIRVFSLTPSLRFEKTFAADYLHMRFAPKK